MNKRLLNKHGQFKNNVKISLLNKENLDVDPKTVIKTKTPVSKLWMWRMLGWIGEKIGHFIKWMLSYPKRFIKWLTAIILMWLLSFLPFKLPNFSFLPVPTQSSKAQETKKDDKKDDKKDESKPTEQSKTNIVTTTITNTVTQTNIITQTNYVNQTLYVTNFVVQPIVVTNTVIKEVPVTVTNVLVIKNGISETNNGAKNKVMNGPAFFFTDDFNTLLQNQQQNPVRGQRVN